MSAPGVQREQKNPYQQSVEEVSAAYASHYAGLSAGDARARLDKYGKNELEAQKPVPRWKKFLAQFQNVLVVLLLIATAISAGLWLYERDAALPYEAIAIFAVVLLNALNGLYPGIKHRFPIPSRRYRFSVSHSEIRGRRHSSGCKACTRRCRPTRSIYWESRCPPQGSHHRHRRRRRSRVRQARPGNRGNSQKTPPDKLKSSPRPQARSA